MAGKVPSSNRQSQLYKYVIGYPAIALHQVYVAELDFNPKGGPQNGLVIPRWLFEKAGIRHGEKAIITREADSKRPVDALINRTIAPVFAGKNNHAAALGPTARFLGQPGPSCCIIYAYTDKLDETAAIDLSFPCGNTKNPESALAICARYGTREFNTIEEPVKKTIKESERERLIVSISGLVVEVGDPYCNPLFAQIPSRLMRKAGLPLISVKALFCNPSRQMPALNSYLVPSEDERISMSGALFGGFPVGDGVVVDIYGRTSVEVDATPKLLNANS